MEIESWRNEETQTVYWRIEIPRSYIIDKCEPYAEAGSPMLDAITPEQGMAIVKDAVLMAMHLKESPNEQD